MTAAPKALDNEVATYTTTTLDEMREVLASSLLDTAEHFSHALESFIGHSALVIFTEDCTGRPQKKFGEKDIVDRVTIAELDVIRMQLRERDGEMLVGIAVVGEAEHPITAWIAATGALLVLTDPVTVAAAESERDVALAVQPLWELVAVGIRHQVATAAPEYLRDSRTASAERSRVIAEMTDTHASTLESLLAVLRSRSTPDETARQTAIDLAASAMVRLRAVSDRDRLLSEEPVSQAFERLREDLNPLARFGDLDLQFVEPPLNGRALPGEVAHAARAIVRGSILALVEQTGVGRVRVQWDCDGRNLLIGIRDDGPGTLSTETASVHHLSTRVDALEGSMSIEGTPGWGSNISVVLPLDAPVGGPDHPKAWGLTSRERDVLALVASGLRNKRIAERLSISENTVKFHVANVLRKVGATSRSELSSLIGQLH